MDEWLLLVQPSAAVAASWRETSTKHRARGRQRSLLSHLHARQLTAAKRSGFVLHGSGMDGARMRLCTGYEFDFLADRHGFVVLYPDGHRGNWNDCRKHASFPAKRENVDDMRFIRTLIARTSFDHGIDEKRVCVFGYSNGGHMAFRLATEAADEVAAVVAVAANLPSADASSCPQKGRTSRVMLVNGTGDPINPYEGGIVTLFGFGSGGAVMSAMASAQHFAERNGLTGWPIRAQLSEGSRGPALLLSVHR